VTGDVGDRAVMLGGGAAGVLCAAGDAAALAAGLEQAIDRSALLRAGALAQAEYYRWERIIDRWQTLYS
ncbi:MAG TPA: glycosyl transferase family 1, partial [Roseiflexaceae bacterium]|nr:glycosyl transferase family 1 [Roseiflexaceae bacterium]